MAERLPARLSMLSREGLLEFAIAACAASDELRGVAHALLTRQQPLPAWCVEGVLQSPDLLTHVMEPLSLQDAPAAVCSAWAVQWTALLRRRRYVRPTVVRTLQLPSTPFALAAMRDGSLCVGGMTRQLTFVSRETGETAGCIDAGTACWLLAAQGESLFVAHSDVVKHSSTGTELARSKPPGMHPNGIALDGSRLFVANGDHITVLDSDSLEELHSIGEGLFEQAVDCAVCGGELFVADAETPGELQVVDFSGNLRRTVRGDFYRPHVLTSHDGRLFMLEGRRVEDEGEDEDEEGEHEGPCEDEQIWAGRRLFVFGAHGELQQIVRLPDESDIYAMCVCGEELVFADGPSKRLFVLRLC